MQTAKPFQIDKALIYRAYLKVKENRGSAGIDGVDLKTYDECMSKNLFIEPSIEPHFVNDSYGYRHALSAHDAIAKARERCFKYEWVLDMDISKFFDTIDHELLMKAVERHVTEKWVLLYIKRWLMVPYETRNGDRIARTMGVPQGSVIGPILANLFLHYVFDRWMQIHNPGIPFERYADDTICHCVSKQQAETLLKQLNERFEQCRLRLNLDKTKIVQCPTSRRGKVEGIEHSFDFLGYTFRCRKAFNRYQMKSFTAFLPAISNKSVKRIHEKIKSWKLHKHMDWKLQDVAVEIESQVIGWYNYYNKFGKTEFHKVMNHLNMVLAYWVRRKYKRFHRKPILYAYLWLKDVALKAPRLFYHWSRGDVPQNCLIPIG